jgi:hypothetical protein
MRILILTHERSGGFSLTNWISNELGIDIYHDPSDEFKTKEIIGLNIFNNPNCVVKVFSKIPTISDINFFNFVKSFDKVIIHKRKNKLDTSISLAYVKNNINFGYHNTYEIDKIWIENNQSLINNELAHIENFDKEIENLSFKSYIETTYEGVFETGEDINKIVKFLDFKNEPKWLDWLNNKRRLRGGKLGINGVKVKKHLI